MKDKYGPQKKYLAQNKRRRFVVSCLTHTEADIIEKLESTKKYATYIKNLIREDLKNN